MRAKLERFEELIKIGGVKRDVVFLVISGVALILSLIGVDWPFDPAWISIILCGVPIVLEAILGLIIRFDIKADVLVSMALIASIAIGEAFAAGEVAAIMQLGSLLEDLTVARARRGIERLVDLTPQTARVVRGGTETVIPAEDVLVDDILRVLPGETVPADGIIIEGTTSIDQSVMTGESLPVDKSVGDEVTSGTVNRFGAFEMRAEQVGSDSSIQRMVRLVQSADAGKAKIVRLADRWATWIVVAALTIAVITWIASGQLIRAVTVLVVFCPCALVLATPTAIMAAIGNATRHGFLVRVGDALEQLAGVRIITFDKTGTLTYGTPQVVAVECVEGGPVADHDELYGLVAAVEYNSEHPLGKAMVNGYLTSQQQSGAEDADLLATGAESLLPDGAAVPDGAEDTDLLATGTGGLLPTTDFVMEPGRGVSGVVAGRDIVAGNRALLAAHNVALPEEAARQAETFLGSGCTVVYVAADGAYAGIVALSDSPRPESANMIAAIKRLGVTPVLLTGDYPSAATTIAHALGIDEVHAECTPETKLQIIDDYQHAGKPVCMIGNGVNDAPALKKADVGIAMGGIGSDIAVDAADIALVNDEIEELPHLLVLSKHMMTTIKINITISMSINLLAVVLAVTGIMGPVVGALVHNAGSVLVIANSALLLRWRSNRMLARDAKQH